MLFNGNKMHGIFNKVNIGGVLLPHKLFFKIQKSVENLNGKAKDLFEKCAVKKTKFATADQAYEGIRNEYYKILESADEKVW